jgi:hypothetical protein
MRMFVVGIDRSSGAMEVDCGAGHVVVIADQADTVAKNCEVVHRR